MAEWVRDKRCFVVYNSPGNALDVVVSKPLNEMTRDDVLTLAAAESWWATIKMARGYDPVLEAAEVGILEMLGTMAAEQPYRIANAPDDAMNIRLSTLAMEVLADPEAELELSPPIRCGVWVLITLLTQTRLAVQRHVIECGLMPAVMAEMRTGLYLVESTDSNGSVTGNAALSMLIFGVVYGSPDEVKVLVAATPGLLAILVNVLQAYMAMETPSDVMVIGLYGAALLLSQLLSFFPPSDGATETLRNEASAIRFVLDHPQTFITDFGLSTSLAMVRTLQLVLGFVASARSNEMRGFVADATRSQDLWSIRRTNFRVCPDPY
jgi:hypothetical protein